MKRLCIIAELTAVLFLASCIRDVNIRPGDEEKPAILAFNPQTEGHGKTRAATYDETWAEFRNFFGGANQEDDFFTAPSPNPNAYPDGYGRKADRRISSFRVLVFHTTTDAAAGYAAGDLVKKGTEYLNRKFDWTEDPNEADKKPPFELAVNKGTYDFIFIANENSLSATFGADGSAGTGNAVSTLTKLKALVFAHGTDIASGKDIPMTGWYPSVAVTSDGISYTEDGTPQTASTGGNNIWNVKMTRSAIRLSFGMHLGKAQYDAWTAHHAGSDPLIYIEEARNAGFVYPFPFGEKNNGATGYDFATTPTAAANTSTTGTTPGKLIVRPDGSADVFFDRIIMPEHLPANKADRTKALKATLRFNYGSQLVEKEIVVYDPATAAWGYALPRNTWVWTRADVRTDVEYYVKVVPWGGGTFSTVTDQWELETDRSEFLFDAAAGSERMSITTDHPGGWKFTAIEYPASEPDKTWVIDNGLLSTTGAAGVTGTANISVKANNSGKVRSARLVLTAGKLSRNIVVTQLPGSGLMDSTPPAGVTMYVGAFWKASQYGERLIRVPRPATGTQTAIDGPWSAYVIEGRDWIVLDTKESGDTGVWTNPGGPAASGNNAGFDDAHRVTGYRTSVSGAVSGAFDPTMPRSDREIYFRVGLNGPYTPTADKPARYGLILLVYTSGTTTNYQRIWVRQGEGADYLFPKNERSHEANVRFSPYNVSIPADKSFNNDGYVQLDQRSADGKTGGGAFAAYPSQVGAYFQNAATGQFARVAWSNLGVFSARPVWNNSGGGSIVYHPSTMEVCPPGYRRPSGTPNITDEFSQSLLLDFTPHQTTTNSVWGYYADGFFDRRAIKSYGTYANSVVALDTKDAAFMGRLFYNNQNATSVFLPASAYLYHDDGRPDIRDGYEGTYWLLLHDPSLTGSRRLMFFSSTYGVVIDGNNYTNNIGTPIRCVVESGPPAVLSVTPQVDFTYGGGAQTANVTSIDTNEFAARWTVTGYSTDNGATFSTTRPAWLTMPASGIGALPHQSIPVTAAVNAWPGIARSVTVRIAQADNPALTATMTVTQTPQPPGVPVPRGVIGYINDPGGPDHGRLTLDGDMSFYGDTSLAPEHRSTQNEHTVWAAYFKFGSLIATGSSNNGAFSAVDIVAAPKEYANAGTAAGALAAVKTQTALQSPGRDAWDVILAMTSLTAGANIPLTSTAAQLTAGQGDACRYHFGENWQMPTNAHNQTFSTGASLLAEVGGIVWLSNSNGKLLPSARVRGETNGIAGNNPGVGHYWSSTSYGGSYANALHFDQTTPPANNAAEGFPANSGKAIRCMPTLQPSPPPFTLSPTMFGFAWDDNTERLATTITTGSVPSGTQVSYQVRAESGDTGDFEWRIDGTSLYARAKTANNSASTSRKIMLAIAPLVNGTPCYPSGEKTIEIFHGTQPGGAIRAGDAIWAPTNLVGVGSPGTTTNQFAASPSDYGSYYIWGKTNAYPYNHPSYNVVTPAGAVDWLSDDPCPAGWRLPTIDEIRSLISNTFVINSMLNGVKGCTFIVSSTGQSIFFPQGGRNYSIGSPYWSMDMGITGIYWTSSVNSNVAARTLYFSGGGGNGGYIIGARSDLSESFRSTYDGTYPVGLNIRCVKNQ